MVKLMTSDDWWTDDRIPSTCMLILWLHLEQMPRWRTKVRPRITEQFRLLFGCLFIDYAFDLVRSCETQASFKIATHWRLALKPHSPAFTFPSARIIGAWHLLLSGTHLTGTESLPLLFSAYLLVLGHRSRPLMETPMSRAVVPYQRLIALMTAGIWGPGTHRAETGPSRPVKHPSQPSDRSLCL